MHLDTNICLISAATASDTHLDSYDIYDHNTATLICCSGAFRICWFSHLLLRRFHFHYITPNPHRSSRKTQTANTHRSQDTQQCTRESPLATFNPSLGHSQDQSHAVPFAFSNSPQHHPPCSHFSQPRMPSKCKGPCTVCKERHYLDPRNLC